MAENTFQLKSNNFLFLGLPFEIGRRPFKLLTIQHVLNEKFFFSFFSHIIWKYTFWCMREFPILFYFANETKWLAPRFSCRFILLHEVISRYLPIQFCLNIHRTFKHSIVYMTRQHTLWHYMHLKINITCVRVQLNWN